MAVGETTSKLRALVDAEGLRMVRALSMCLLAACLAMACQAAPSPAPEEDLAAVREVFEANIEAIQQKDREAYLACYRDDDRLVRAGIEGVKLGYGDLERGTAKTGSDEWPEKLEASDVFVHWLAPGVAYGSYRFAVTIDGETQRGLSERVFLRGEDGRWRISVSTAFYEPPPSSPLQAPSAQTVRDPQLPDGSTFCYATTSGKGRRRGETSTTKASLTCSEAPLRCDLEVEVPGGGKSQRRRYDGTKSEHGYAETQRVSERVLRLVGTSGSALDTVTRYEVELDEAGRVVRFDGSSEGDPSWRAFKVPSCE